MDDWELMHGTAVVRYEGSALRRPEDLEAGFLDCQIPSGVEVRVIFRRQRGQVNGAYYVGWKNHLGHEVECWVHRGDLRNLEAHAIPAPIRRMRLLNQRLFYRDIQAPFDSPTGPWFGGEAVTFWPDTEVEVLRDGSARLVVACSDGKGWLYAWVDADELDGNVQPEMTEAEVAAEVAAEGAWLRRAEWDWESQRDLDHHTWR